MTAIDKLLKPLIPKIRCQASTFEFEGSSISRRIPGQINYSSDEAHGYRSMIIYIEKGLGVESDLISKLLYALDKEVSNMTHYLPSKYMFRIGTVDEALYPATHPHASGRWFPEKWKSWVEAVALSDPSDGPVFIPALFKGQYNGYHTVPGPNDLLIFICRNKAIYMPKKTINQYMRFRKKTIWFFLKADIHEISAEMGEYVPNEKTIPEK